MATFDPVAYENQINRQLTDQATTLGLDKPGVEMKALVVPACYYAFDRFALGATLDLSSYLIIGAAVYALAYLPSVRVKIRDMLPYMLTGYGFGAIGVVAASIYAYFHGVGYGLSGMSNVYALAAAVGVYVASGLLQARIPADLA